MHAITSHRPSRLSCIFGFGAALALAGSAITAPAPARASGVDSLLVTPPWNTPAVVGLPFQFTASIWLPGPEPPRDVCSTDTIHFSYTDALTTLPADYAFDTPQFLCEISEAGDWGAHEFTIIPIHAGTQTLTVTDVSFPSVTPGTLTFTVAPGPATSLTVSDMPAASVQDAATPFRVTLKDAWGNVATGYTGTVGFTSTDPGAGLPGSYTFTAGDAGTRLFTVYFSKTVTGLEAVTATDTVHALTDDGWTNVGAAPHFGFQCSDQTAGSEASCLVTAQNADGTTFTGYRGTVHFTSSDPLAERPINYTFNSTDNGWRTFATTFKTAGVQTLSATDTVNAAITGTGSLNVLGGDTVGVSIVGLPSAMVAGPIVVAVKTTDTYGNWGSGGTVHFTSTDPKAVLPADFTFHSSTYGTHQFTVTLESLGMRTLTVSGSNWLGSFSGSASTSVVNGSATKFAVTGLASPRIAGVAGSLTVRATDAYDNTDPSYRGTIHFTSSDAGAIFPADYAFIGGDAGTHTFSLTLKTAGSQAVRARDTVTASITGLQSGIVVTPAAATTLAVSGLVSPYVAGAAHSVTVTAKDAYGNTATGYRGTITFTSTDARAVLPANYAFTAGDSGIHRFALGVTLKTAGTQAVRARDTVTATITGLQSRIVVTPAAATTLVMSGLSSPRTAGVAGNLTVTAKDVYGNTATGYRGTITFTSTDARAVLPANYTFTATSAGTHTFSVTLNTAGTQAIRARDTVTATITGLQKGIVVS